MGLAGQVAVITGGSAGIGLAAAVALAEQGVHVAVAGRSPTRLSAAREQIEIAASAADVLTIAADVCNESDMQRMADETMARFARIDILIAAAGMLRPKNGAIRTVRDMPLCDWREVLDTNLTGAFLANRAVLPVMTRQHRGQIVNIASTSARKGYAFDAAYCASKFALIGMSEALAEEARHHGIRLQTLSPGAIETPIWAQNGPIPAPRDVISAARVTAALLYLLTLPMDSYCAELVVAPEPHHGSLAWGTPVTVVAA